MKEFKQFSQNWDGIIRNNTLSEATIQGATAKGWVPRDPWRPKKSDIGESGYRMNLYLGMKQEADVFEIHSHVIPETIVSKSNKFKYSVEVTHEVDNIRDGRPEFEFIKEGFVSSLADAIKESEKLIQAAVDKFLKQHGPAKKGNLLGLIGFNQKGLDQIKNWKSQKTAKH